MEINSADKFSRDQNREKINPVFLLPLKDKIMENNKFKWWGYKHTSGSIQVKRYFSRLDISEANDSPFCEIVYGPFYAENRDDALEIMDNFLNYGKEK